MNTASFRTVAPSLAFLALAPGVLSAAPSGLVHHWNFDEGPDWHDSAFQAAHAGTLAHDSQGASHATLQNMGASNWISGRQFTGLEFDGINQHLSVTSSLATTLGGSASLSFWIRTTQAGTATPATAPGLAGQAGAGGVQWGWLDASGRIGLGLDGVAVVQSAAAVNDGKWHHVAITRNAATGLVRIHVDGALSASATGATGTRSNAFTSLGRIEGAGHFAGRLDQVTIFNRVITAAEVVTQRDNHAPKSWNLSSDGVNDRPFTTPSVFARAFDAEQDALAVRSWTAPAHGAVAHNGDGSFTYTAVADYVGTDSFDVTIEDGKGGYHRSTISLKIIDEPVGGKRLPVTQFTGFAPVQAGGTDLLHSGMRVPRAVDWNGDGLKDILVGAGGYVWRYLNNGTAAAPAFAAAVKVQANGADIYAGTTGNSPITLADMTGDGVADLILADSGSKLRLYRNTAAAGATPVYAAHVFIKQSNGTSDFVLPDKRFDIGDFDGDGRPDIVTGTYSGNVQLFLNVNTAATPRFQGSTVLFGESYNAYPRFCDLGLNGQTDLVRGINWGDVKYWLDVPNKGLAGTQYLAIKDALGATPALQSLTDGVIADFADFNGDGKNDMLLGGHNSGADKKVFIAFGVSKTAAESIAEIEAIYDANLADLGTALSANSNALLNQVNAANLNLVNHLTAGSLGTREAVFTALGAHIGKYDFLQYQELDTGVYHHVPSIVLQNWVILGYLLPDTPARRAIVADVMGLTGTARTIYLENGLALGDNGKSVPAAYGTIRDFMRRYPREAFPDAILTFDQLYGDQRGGFVWTPNSTKNTFGQWALGNANEWAGDLTTAIQAVLGAGSASGDYFTFVMGHEVVHSLDNYVNTRANADLRRRWGARMVYAGGPHVRAGTDGWYSQSATQANFQALGYYTPATQTWGQAWDAYWSTGPGAAFNSLASMRIDIKTFFGSPQESLATQANHHWANGRGRLIGALDRFRRAEAQGIEPMKANLTEVVDFIDYISTGMNRVNLVETKNQGGVVVYFDHLADLERDDDGRITRITVDGRTYQFTLNPAGIVTQVADAVVPPQPDPEKLRAWWKFDESSGTVADDATGRPQDGVVTGATWTTGISGNALSFGGANHGVLMGTPAAMTGTGDFTVSAWVKVAPGSSGGAVIQQREPGGTGYHGQYALNVNPGGTVSFYVYGTSTHQFNLTTAGTIDDGEWHLIAGTRQGTNGTIFIDGTSAATGSSSATLMPLISHAVSVGYDNRDLGVRRFAGLIDEVKIHERLLSAADLKTEYDALVPNHAPVFDPIAVAAFEAAEGAAVTGESYDANLSNTASDPEGGTLIFIKEAGPAWLGVGTDGSLSGTPAASDESTSTVVIRALDPSGAWAEVSFDLTVVVRRSLAVNFSNSNAAATAVLATENTGALDATVAVGTPVVWNNQPIDDAGNGPLASGRGSGTYSGVSVSSFSSVPWQQGSNALSGSDASQRVFHYYLDDADGGSSYFNGDSVGASIHLSGLGQFLATHHATTYTLTLLFNSDSTSTTAPFRPATVRNGVPAAPSATAIGNLGFLGTITPALLGDGKQPLPAVGTSTAGKRGWGQLTGLSADSITISLPVRSGSTRGSVAGFILTPTSGPLAIIQDGYAQWTGTHFGGESGDPETAGEYADPNRDGLVNLLAYAMGIDPLAPPAAGATPAQRGSIELVQESDAFHFDYQRDTTATAVDLVVEQSGDLADPESWSPAAVEEEILSEENGIRTIRATYTPPSGDVRRFFRLRASR